MNGSAGGERKGSYVRQRQGRDKGMELWRCLVGLGDANYLELHCPNKAATSHMWLLSAHMGLVLPEMC